MKRQLITIAISLAALLAGCRGGESEAPPIHLNLNMDFQERFDPQEANPFFADGRAMRSPVPGTVARGLLREDTGFYLGREANGDYVAEVPVPVTRALLERGQERYDIYCAVCHGRAGDGQGIIMVGVAGQGYGFTPVPSYHDDRLRQVTDGYIYDVITNGVRNMPAYAQQIPVADRWAIVAFVRALQRSQHATEGDLPPSVRAEVIQRTGTTGAQAPGGADGGSADTTAAQQ